MSLEMFNLKGKRALVTGSSQGIGLGLAEGLGKAGATIILNGRDKAKLEATRKDMAAKGIGVQVSAFDVTNETEVNEAVAALEKESAIDILINNAGMQFRSPLEDFPSQVP